MKWEFPEHVEESTLAKYTDIHPLVAKILYHRGFSPDNLDDVFNPHHKKFSDPFLLPDMQKAVERIKHAYDIGETVCIWGDYDIDGTTSQAILHTALREWGMKDLMVYTPHRMDEGYGLNSKAIKMLADEGVSLLIALDLGTSNAEEVRFANTLGMDVIIADHHKIKEDDLPPALAFINPHLQTNQYPYEDFAAVGVTFMLILALTFYAFSPPSKATKETIRQLIAIGTIGDMMPMTGENRALTYNGMQSLQSSTHRGLKALSYVSGTSVQNINEREISFGIGPRINAAGRLYYAEIVRTIMFPEKGLHQSYLASLILDNANNERKELTSGMEDVAVAQVEGMRPLPRLIMVSDDSWKLGVLGLLAGRIVGRYHRPTLSFSCYNGKCKGSARSIDGVDIHSLLSIADKKGLLTHFGGHQAAAGFGFLEENAEKVQQCIEEALSTYPDDVFIQKIDIDAEIFPEECTFDIVHHINEIGPFGKEYEMPILLLRNAKMKNLKTQGKTLKLNFELTDGTILPVVFFASAHKKWMFTRNKLYDLCGSIYIDTYNGKYEVAFNLEDFRPSDYIEH